MTMLSAAVVLAAQKEQAVIDGSQSFHGYVMVRYKGKNPKIKVQVIKDTAYTYDLNARDAFEVYPFTEGNGVYVVKVFEDVGGDRDAQLLSQSIFVSLINEFVPFLYPNQYVNFHSDSRAVKLACELAEGKDSLGKTAAVYDYVVENICYDYEKAKNVQSGYLPNVDETLRSKKGICLDYAALMTAMLRSLHIPAKLVVGYTGELYHAWVSVYLEEEGWIDNLFYFNGKEWVLMDPTFLSSGKRSREVREYVGNRENYYERYCY